MANAIKKISVARGYDVTRYTLQCFGGAGGQHACRGGRRAGHGARLRHPLAGVLSAYGMGLADQNVMREAAVELPLAPALPAVAAPRGAGGGADRAELLRQGVAADRHRGSRTRACALRGHRLGARRAVRRRRAAIDRLRAAYRQRFAFLMQARALVVEAVSVEAVVRATRRPRQRLLTVDAGPRRPVRTSGASAAGAGGTRRWSCANRPAGRSSSRPAIIAEERTPPPWSARLAARVTDLDHLLLERVQARARRGARSAPRSTR